jgi:hypothetical protein
MNDSPLAAPTLFDLRSPSSEARVIRAHTGINLRQAAKAFVSALSGLEILSTRAYGSPGGSAQGESRGFRDIPIRSGWFPRSPGSGPPTSVRHSKYVGLLFPNGGQGRR